MMIEVITVILVAYLCVSPYFYAKAVKFGMKIMEEPEKAVSEPIFNVPTKKKQPKMTAEEKRTVQILENINNYNGTSFGQKKIQKEK